LIPITLVGMVLHLFFSAGECFFPGLRGEVEVEVRDTANWWVAGGGDSNECRSCYGIAFPFLSMSASQLFLSSLPFPLNLLTFGFHQVRRLDMIELFPIRSNVYGLGQCEAGHTRF